MTDDPGGEALQLGARLQAELFVERNPGVLVHGQRLGVTSAAVEREHQLEHEPLAERVRADGRLELGERLRVPAERELRVEHDLEQPEALLLESRRGRPSERAERQVIEHQAPPHGERHASLCNRPVARPLCQRRARRPVRLPEDLDIDRGVAHVEHVPGSTSMHFDADLSEQTPQP